DRSPRRRSRKDPPGARAQGALARAGRGARGEDARRIHRVRRRRDREVEEGGRGERHARQLTTMAKLNLTLACGDYDLLRPLIEGAARAPGIDFNALTMASPERHGRMLRHQEFDVCELSLVAYLVAR